MKKSKKPKKIRSIKHQITFTFIGLLFLSILTISMINGAFLEKYYVSKKTETLLEAREVLSQINTDSMTEDDVESEQEELSSEIIQESSVSSEIGLVSFLVTAIIHIPLITIMTIPTKK